MNNENKLDVSIIFKATSFRLLKNGFDILIPHKITEELKFKNKAFLKMMTIMIMAVVVSDANEGHSFPKQSCRKSTHMSGDLYLQTLAGPAGPGLCWRVKTVGPMPSV